MGMMEGLSSKFGPQGAAESKSEGTAAAAPANGSGLSGSMTMGELIGRYPSAQRALFQKYHIGGCSSCGYDESDTLQQVLANHNVTEVQGAIDYILQADEGEKKIQIGAAESARLLKENAGVKLIDVRDEYERRTASIPGSMLLTRQLAEEMMNQWDKNTPIIFHCHHGIRSLDAASYFAGHGFTNVKSMTGGIEAWANEVDPQTPRY